MLNSEVIDDSEVVSRYVFSTSNYKTSLQKLAYNAFLPPPTYPDEISIFRISFLTEFEIWDIGHRIVGNHRNPPIPAKGRGDLAPLEIKSIDKNDGSANSLLYLEIETTPHPRHANIRNVALVDKAKQKVLAQKLADKTSLRVNI